LSSNEWNNTSPVDLLGFRDSERLGRKIIHAARESDQPMFGGDGDFIGFHARVVAQGILNKVTNVDIRHGCIHGARRHE
jgi:hypothetical protein